MRSEFHSRLRSFLSPFVIVLLAKYGVMGIVMLSMPIGLLLIPVFDALNIGLTPFTAVGDVKFESHTVAGIPFPMSQRVEIHRFDHPALLTSAQWMILGALHMLLTRRLRIRRPVVSSIIFVTVTALLTWLLIWAFSVSVLWTYFKM